MQYCVCLNSICTHSLLILNPSLVIILYLSLNIIFNSKMDGRRVRTHHVTYDSSKIIRLWLFGKSASEISVETGASLSTVYRWIRRYGAQGSFTYHIPNESYLCNSVRQYNSRAQAFYLCGNPCAVCLFAGRQSK